MPIMASSFTHRKLLLSLNNNNNNTNINIPTVETCLYFCNKLKNDTVSLPGYCPTTCLDICPSTCHHSLFTVYNYTPSQPSRPHNLSPLLISMLILLASVFLLITFYVIYTQLCYHYYHFTPHRSSSGEVMREENEGTMVFNPIWYGPTVGLNPTVINSIKVIKYEEGVNKESDCAVCLGEFVVGDDLRILPKCNHAFHLPCVDMWLTSHVTCPLCRALIDPAVDSDYGRTIEVSANVIRNNTSVREDESPREEVVVVVDNNNNNSNNNVEDSSDGNIKEQGLENNKGSGSQRWSLERGAANLVSRSFSCSGKIFSCRYNNRPSPNS